MVCVLVSRASPARQTGSVTADQMALIASDSQVMHGQAVIAGTRVPVSVILDCLAAGMTAEGDHCRVPGGYRRRSAGCRCLRRGAGARGTAAAAAVAVRFKLGENLPVSSAAILTPATTSTPSARRGLGGAPGPDVVAAATAAERVLISLDVGLAGIRAYPPGSPGGIVLLRLSDQSAGAVSKAISDLAAFTGTDSLTAAVAVLRRGLLRIRRP
jgi:predicted nuclease of predicted toxin-antitoxin system